MAEEQDERRGCLGALIGLFGGSKEAAVTGDANLPYRLRDDFLSPAERSFHVALTAAAGTAMVVCPKVNLADVFFVSRPHENKGARGRISQKHVDFLLCEATSMRPVLGVELDDSSHRRTDRQARDEFVDRVFAAADLPLLHIAVAQAYSVADLSVRIAGQVGRRTEARPVSASPEAVVDGAPPVCPKCGIPMVLRTPSKGGEQFWGCANFPRCRQTAAR